MKKRITKILGVVLSLALLSSLAMVATPVAAQPGENVWEEIELDFPLIAPGTDVELLAQAADGTLFASVYDGVDYIIYRSEPGADGVAGWEWDETEFSSTDPIWAISPAPNWGDNDTVYVAAGNQIYRCTSAADDTPILLRQIVDNTTLAASVVYDMDLWTDGNSVWIMVATDIDVLVMEDALFAEWIDMDVSISFDGAHFSQDGTPMGTMTPAIGAALFCAFAPDFDQSGLIWAVIGDDVGDMWIAATISPGQWGQVVNSVQVTTGANFGDAEFVFADYYSSTTAPILFAAIDDNAAGEGDLYIIEGGLDADNSVATPLLVDGGGLDFRSIQVSDQVMLGGEMDAAKVWVSQNGGDTFVEATKQPTGDSFTQVLMAPGAFDPDEGIAYAATSGVESAFSYSVDGGMTWNQTNFVDTNIDEIIDLGFDPITASQPGMMITTDTGASTDSLWVSPDLTGDPAKWQRTNCTQISALDFFYMVEYAMDGSVIVLYGEDGAANQIIQKSADNGQMWANWRTLPVAIGGIHDLVVYDSATIFAACDNGFYGTTRFGPAKQRLDTNVLMTVAIQPGFDANDPDNSTVVAGSDSGEIFVSTDGGATWSAAQDVSGVADDDIFVAFDADFATADADGEGLIYFCGSYDEYIGVAEIDDVDGTADFLEDDYGDDSSVIESHGYVGLYVSPGDAADGGNALYALCTDGSLNRLLLHEWDSMWEEDPTSDPDPAFGLWGTSGSNILWTIDTDDAELWALEDTCAGMITGVAVNNETLDSADVSWDEMTGANDYEVYWEWDIGDDWDWTDETEFEIDGLDDNHEFVVLVRVGDQYNSDGPWTSRWSSDVTFYTLEYVATPENEVPPNGMQDAPLLPSFVWGSVSNAEYYEFQLSTNPAYDEDGFVSELVDGTPVNIDAPTTAYTQSEELTNDINHYWIVRAVSTNSLSGEMAYSGWCFSNFHTRMEEIPPVTVNIPPQLTPVVTVSLPQPTVTVNVPDVIVDSPDVVVNVPPVVTVTQQPTPPQQTFVLPERDDPSTPVYIWVIVGIGAILTIAVIVLIIRTRRVV